MRQDGRVDRISGELISPISISEVRRCGTGVESANKRRLPTSSPATAPPPRDPQAGPVPRTCKGRGMFSACGAGHGRGTAGARGIRVGI